MRAIMVMFDSLNRRMLPPYGCDWTQAPNFGRLAEHTVTMETSYVGSMPCMPARRELHTGRLNFLHRSWGPVEPFDDSMPEILKQNGVHTHLTSDHYHYWEDGGSTYHTRYSTWECSRGQEGDPWKGVAADFDLPESLNNRRLGNAGSPWVTQDWVNRRYAREVGDFPQAQTFTNGLHFLETNHAADSWLLHIETFDPHEPFFSHPRFRELYPQAWNGPHFDWPPYGRVAEGRETVEHMRMEYASLLSMCDYHLGRILDFMDAHDMWKDTMLIVNTDHGFMLGEHGWWAKCVMPFYDEVARTPLFIWDPREKRAGERRSSLVQTIDLAPTVLEFFGIPRTRDMLGVPLRGVIASDEPVREAGLFGIHGGQVNVTDGRYVYMRGPANSRNEPLFEYTLMPTRHGAARAFIEPGRLECASLAAPFGFTKRCPLLRVPAIPDRYNMSEFGTMLFDTASDPGQERPLNLTTPVAHAIELRMVGHLVRLMSENDAPPEQYERLGLDRTETDDHGACARAPSADPQRMR